MQYIARGRKFLWPRREDESFMQKKGLVPVIEVEGLRKVYHRIVAVDDVSFVMYQGEAFGFLGPNGAGKSTVVKILTGLVTPTQGTARVLGNPISHRETRKRIGYLPELPTFHRWLQAGEFFQIHCRLFWLRGPFFGKRFKTLPRPVLVIGPALCSA